MENATIISNTCVGWGLMQKNNILPYNNPFVASLIYDNDYLKLINNLNYYANINPIIITEPKYPRYKHPIIKDDYPIIQLDDIKIHYIHESTPEECLDKYIRRNERFLKLLNSENSKIYTTLSYSEILENHNNIEEFIGKFFYKSENINIYKIFLGPTIYNKDYQNYIPNDDWNTIDLIRDSSGVYKFNNQDYNIAIFDDYINNFI